MLKKKIKLIEKEEEVIDDLKNYSIQEHSKSEEINDKKRKVNAILAKYSNE